MYIMCITFNMYFYFITGGISGFGLINRIKEGVATASCM